MFARDGVTLLALRTGSTQMLLADWGDRHGPFWRPVHGRKDVRRLAAHVRMQVWWSRSWWSAGWTRRVPQEALEEVTTCLIRPHRGASPAAPRRASTARCSLWRADPPGFDSLRSDNPAMGTGASQCTDRGSGRGCYGVASRQTGRRSPPTREAGPMLLLHNERVVRGSLGAAPRAIAEPSQAAPGSTVAFRAYAASPPPVGLRPARPGGDRRHVHLGDGLAAKAPNGSSSRMHLRSLLATPSHPRSWACPHSRPGAYRRGVTTSDWELHPVLEADGSHHAVFSTPS